jgi:hypothetical protein
MIRAPNGLDATHAVSAKNRIDHAEEAFTVESIELFVNERHCAEEEGHCAEVGVVEAEERGARTAREKTSAGKKKADP